MPILIAGKPPSNSSGFTYIIVLVAVIVLGIVVEAATVVTSRVAQADRESELLFRGQAYQRAIKSYYEAGGTFPHMLSDLESDPRFAGKKHIRALYPDPFARGERKEWALIRVAGGGISGVASTSKDEPLKKANFPEGLEKLADAKLYSDWFFEFVPPLILKNPSPPSPAPITMPPVLRTN